MKGNKCEGKSTGAHYKVSLKSVKLKYLSFLWKMPLWWKNFCIVASLLKVEFIRKTFPGVFYFFFIWSWKKLKTFLVIIWSVVIFTEIDWFQTDFKKLLLNSFHTTDLFPCPLKILENLSGFLIFSGRPLAWNGITWFISLVCFYTVKATDSKV